MFDVTLRGSLIASGETEQEARVKARALSAEKFPGRRVDVHDVDGQTIIYSFRNGIAEYAHAVIG